MVGRRAARMVEMKAGWLADQTAELRVGLLGKPSGQYLDVWMVDLKVGRMEDSKVELKAGKMVGY